jgi:hypothetical protein
MKLWCCVSICLCSHSPSSSHLLCDTSTMSSLLSLRSHSLPLYRRRTLIWDSSLQQENNPAATGNVIYYVDYNKWTLLNVLMHFSQGKVKYNISCIAFSSNTPLSFVKEPLHFILQGRIVCRNPVGLEKTMVFQTPCLSIGITNALLKWVLLL